MPKFHDLTGVDSLNNVMHFDHVIQVHADGTVSDAPSSLYAPEVYVDCDAEGSILDLSDDAIQIDGSSPRGTEWQLMTGYTGQYGYRGAVLHPSEYVGGALADDILSAPGYYVVTEVRGLYPEDVTEAQEEELNAEPIGWVVAYIPADD
jgi:hypothetical protein